MLSSSSSCVLEPLVLSEEFRSGAVYEGEVAARGSGRQRSGHGTFRWPSGLRYCGRYAGDKRHGRGVMEWPDGSRYEGEFREDLRHGEGRHEWSNGEVRERESVLDARTSPTPTTSSANRPHTLTRRSDLAGVYGELRRGQEVRGRHVHVAVG